MTDTHVVGAYACAPWAEGRREFFRTVLALPGCTGLEVPLLSEGYTADRAWLDPLLSSGGAHVATLIPATMEALHGSPWWGLASPDASGRRESLDFMHDVRDTVESLSQEGATIIAVEVHSAPTAHATAPAFFESLCEIAQWEWCGSAVEVEHCDAAVGGRRAQKGFLHLEEECDAIARVRELGMPTRVGLSLNWGRSVIDERSTRGAVDQILRARSSNVLDGLMFSGAVAQDSDFGPAWSDAHAPLRHAGDSSGERFSLLTAQEMKDSIRAAGGGLLFDGVKVSVRPASAEFGKRVDTIGRIWDAFARAEV